LLIPVITSPPWHLPDSTPPFFADGTYRSVLRPDETVLIIPKQNGQQMAWQAATDFAFRIPDGYLGPTPENVPESALNRGLSRSYRFVPDPVALQQAMASHDATAIVLDQAARKKFETLIRDAGFVPVYDAGDVSVWRPG
jgi:hypothetical protein